MNKPFRVCQDTNGHWVARCDSFGLFAVGPTMEAATEALADALLIYLEAHRRRGTLTMLNAPRKPRAQ